MKRLFFTFIALLSFVVSNAQIGYQVALLNTATGEPRANETVTCEIKLTNSEGATVYEGTNKATSNDFGVVSLTVGDANTFSEMDWSKLPLYISVSVDGKLVGRTEVLTVPVAEYAKKTGVLTYENIANKKIVGAESIRLDYPMTGSNQPNTYAFNGKQLTMTVYLSGGVTEIYTGRYFIDGNTIFGILNRKTDWYYNNIPFVGHYSPEDDTIYIAKGDF